MDENGAVNFAFILYYKSIERSAGALKIFCFSAWNHLYKLYHIYG